jgi:hypothetical protein
MGLDMTNPYADAPCNPDPQHCSYPHTHAAVSVSKTPSEAAESLSETRTQQGMPETSYSWALAAQDLALCSSLTMKQASDLTLQLEKHTKLNPEEALGLLSSFLFAIRENSYSEAGTYLSRLLNL